MATERDQPDQPPVPMFSVVIPTWNRDSLTADAVRSVLAQTWTDFELIVVDDGSTDGTVATLAAISDSRLRVQTRIHEGVTSARNSGAASARGQYLAFLDSDDRALEQWLDRFAGVARSSGADVILGGATVTSADGSRQEVLPPASPASADEVVHRFLAGCFALRRSLFEAVGGYASDLAFGENTELALRLFTRDPSPRFAVVPEPLVWQRAPGPHAADARVGSARAVLRRYDRRHDRFPRLWASYHAIAGVDDARHGRRREARRHFVQALRSDPRSLEHAARLGISLLPGASRWVWRPGTHPSRGSGPDGP